MNLHYGAAFIAIILVLLIRMLYRIGKRLDGIESWHRLKWESDPVEEAKIDAELRERERRKRDNEL